MQQYGSNYFAGRPPPTQGVGSKGLNSTFSEHVAYQIKWNHECSYMVANILPVVPPRLWGQKVKIQLFSKHGHVAYQI